MDIDEIHVVVAGVTLMIARADRRQLIRGSDCLPNEFLTQSSLPDDSIAQHY